MLNLLECNHAIALTISRNHAIAVTIGRNHAITLIKQSNYECL